MQACISKNSNVQKKTLTEEEEEFVEAPGAIQKRRRAPGRVLEIGEPLRITKKRGIKEEVPVLPIAGAAPTIFPTGGFFFPATGVQTAPSQGATVSIPRGSTIVATRSRATVPRRTSIPKSTARKTPSRKRAAKGTLKTQLCKKLKTRKAFLQKEIKTIDRDLRSIGCRR